LFFPLADGRVVSQCSFIGGFRKYVFHALSIGLVVTISPMIPFTIKTIEYVFVACINPYKNM
jgi:hypothetical protein